MAQQPNVSSDLGNDGSNGFPFLAFLEVTLKGRSWGAQLQQFLGPGNAKTVEQPLRIQGLGAEENSQSNAGGGSVWSDHVKRAKIAADAVASEESWRVGLRRAAQKANVGRGLARASATSLRTALWAGPKLPIGLSA